MVINLMEIVDMRENKLKEILINKQIPYIIKYFTYFNGQGGYRNFSIKDIIGNSYLFEYERFENPIIQNFKVYFVADNNKAYFIIKEIHNIENDPLIKKGYVLYFDGINWYEKIIYYTEIE